MTKTKRSLPLFITKKNKMLVGFALWGTAAVLYLATNHFHLFKPHLLPMFWIDQVIPLVPDTVLIYTSEYLLFGLVFIMSQDMENLSKYFYSFLALQLASVVIFSLWPTTFPRDQFPLPAMGMNPVTEWVFSTLRATDSPASCAPSLHISSCYLSSFIFLNEQRGKFLFFFLWSTLVGISTLTTKQHYFIDVVLGLGMAILFYWVFHRFIPYRKLDQANR